MNFFDKVVSMIIDIAVPALEDVPCPFVPTPAKKNDNAAPLRRDNLVVYGGIPFEQQVTPDGVYEDTRISNAVTLRSAKVSPGECPAHLKEAKYRELKTSWARQLSAAQTAALFKGKRGYSLRILEDYWAAFNAQEKES